MITKELKGPRGVKLILDSSQVFPDDPGAGTPAIIEWRGRTATYWCAVGEGEVEDKQLSHDILDWLDSPEVVGAVEELYA